MGPDSVVTVSGNKLSLHRCQDSYNVESASFPSGFSSSSTTYDTDDMLQFNILAESSSGLVVYYRSPDLGKIAKYSYSDSSQSLTLTENFDATSFGTRLAYYPTQNVAFSTITTASTYGFAIVDTGYSVNVDISSYVSGGADLTTLITDKRLYFANGRLYSIFGLSQNTQCSGGNSLMIASIKQE